MTLSDIASMSLRDSILNELFLSGFYEPLTFIFEDKALQAPDHNGVAYSRAADFCRGGSLTELHAVDDHYGVIFQPELDRQCTAVLLILPAVQPVLIVGRRRDL